MAKLKYDRARIAHMSPYRLQQEYSEQELHNAYRKFRREFLERKKAFAAAGMAEDGRLKDAAEVFDKTMVKSEKTAVVHALQEITKWLGSKESTPEGAIAADKKRLETLKAKGFKIKNVDELRKFGKFMNEIRPYYDAVNKYEPEKAAQMWNRVRKKDVNISTQLYQLAEEKNISIENVMRNFDWYAQNMDQIRKADLTVQRGRSKGRARKKKWTAKELSKRIGVYSVG